MNKNKMPAVAYFAAFILLLLGSSYFAVSEKAVADGEIEISSCAELQLIGNDPDYPRDGDYVLVGNIPCESTATWNPDGDGGYYGFEPIGTIGSPFIGTLDGQGHKITGLRIHRASNTALFYQARDVVIRNLGLEDVDIAASGVSNRAAALAVVLSGNFLVENVWATGSVVSQANNAGGLIGSISTGSTGIVREARTYDMGVSGFDYAGGLIGSIATDNVTLENSWSSAEVEALSNAAGGLVSEVNFGSQIINSRFSGTVSAGQTAGGIAGGFSGFMSGSYSDGIVHGAQHSGGLVGLLAGEISDSFSLSNVEGSAMAGGLVAVVYGGLSPRGGYITNSYSGGQVAGAGATYGLAGPDLGSGAVTTNSYWNTDTSLVLTSDFGEGRTNDEMKNIATFTSWDIETTSDHDLNNGYPFLSWQAGDSSPIWYIYSDEDDPDPDPESESEETPSRGYRVSGLSAPTTKEEAIRNLQARIAALIAQLIALLQEEIQKAGN